MYHAVGDVGSCVVLQSEGWQHRKRRIGCSTMPCIAYPTSLPSGRRCVYTLQQRVAVTTRPALVDSARQQVRRLAIGPEVQLRPFSPNQRSGRAILPLDNITIGVAGGLVPMQPVRRRIMVAAFAIGAVQEHM